MLITFILKINFVIHDYFKNKLFDKYVYEEVTYNRSIVEIQNKFKR